MRFLSPIRAPLAEPRPDPRFIGNYVSMGAESGLGTAIKWGSIGAVALLGGFLLLLWKDAKRPVLRRNPARFPGLRWRGRLRKRRISAKKRAEYWKTKLGVSSLKGMGGKIAAMRRLQKVKYDLRRSASKRRRR